MKYEQIQIPHSLKDCIQSFYTLKSNFTDVSAKSFTTFADGCPGLIFQHFDEGILYQNNKKLPAFILYGQATKHNAIQVSGRFNTIGLFLYPNALKTVFGLDASELTDTCIDLDFLSSKQGFKISEKMLNCLSTREQIETLSSYLFSQIQKTNEGENKIMKFALNKIIQSSGTISLKKLQAELQLSERSFERNFKQYVGIAPKLFSRICRFQSSLKQLKHNKYNTLTDIAFENDYADQSHFIRSFKEFAGFSPYKYQKQLNKISENFSGVMN